MKKDYCIRFLDTDFECVDKGFDKNEPVDLVLRPEDIKLYSSPSEKGQLDGDVTSTVFKGSFYEMLVKSGDYIFTVQSTSGFKEGEKVRLKIDPQGIHIMKKFRTQNEFFGEITGENTVSFCGGEFEFTEGAGTFENGEKVKVTVPFSGVKLTDDQDDGNIGGNVTQTLYKGTYYQVQVYTDTDEDFYTDTADEWDMGDRVGINIDSAAIKIEKRAEEEDEEN